MVSPGQKVPVGTVLAYIDGEGARAAATTPQAKARVFASPAARKLARDLGVDLSTVRGTGPHGVVERHDVEAEGKPAPGSAPAPATAPTVSGIRRAIASAMAKSNREIPHYYLQTRIDMHAALTLLQERNARLPVERRILPAALLLRATALALAKVPHLNGYWNDGIDLRERINIGVAISLRQGGLTIPAIHDADTKTLEETMEAMSDLIVRARAGSLKSSELSDATVTVTNLGDLGVETVFGVIYPPQIALVGFGRIVEQPWACDGLLGIRPILSATLAADHRASDGHEGAQFLTALADALARPETL
jgi:pyruvate dehydrogenase E2 component (dihydrolipoamide acetyltransferase)